MTPIEQDILSTPTILRQTLTRVTENRSSLLPFLHGPVAFLGCGSSYHVSTAAAAFYEQKQGAPGQAVFPSDYFPRANWTHVAISRSGTTTELVMAMKRVREAGGRCLLLLGDQKVSSEAYADAVLPLEFAAEQGVVQTRFVVAAIYALRLLIDGAIPALVDLPDQLEQMLKTFDATPLLRFDHVVFLGRGWRYGLARAAALNLQETAVLVPESYQTLDYRHGPIASIDERSLVWCLDRHDDAESAAVMQDVRLTGATIHWPDVDPLIAVTMGQIASLRKAEIRGVDPMAPRHLSRAVILPGY